VAGVELWFETEPWPAAMNGCGCGEASASPANMSVLKGLPLALAWPLEVAGDDDSKSDARRTEVGMRVKRMAADESGEADNEDDACELADHGVGSGLSGETCFPGDVAGTDRLGCRPVPVELSAPMKSVRRRTRFGLHNQLERVSGATRRTGKGAATPTTSMDSSDLIDRPSRPTAGAPCGSSVPRSRGRAR
jgi:hypothetical protein